MAAAEGRLQPDDYLWPLSTLRDTLINPGATLPSPKLRSIFTYHIDRLRTPWRRAKSGSKDGPNVFSQPTVSPVPGVQIEINEAARALASRLAEEAGIAGVDACLIVKSYLVYVHEGSVKADVEQVLTFYTEECLALAQIALEVLHLSAGREGEWTALALDVKEAMVPDPAEYMEGLFRGWAGLAQTPVSEKHALFWATHQLRIQSATLDILFFVLYDTPGRSTLIAQGLIRGFMMSDFATEQANREIWDSECHRLASRIRDIALLIVVESLGLSNIVTPGEDIPSALRESKDSILSLHLFINDQTSELSSIPSEPINSPSPTPIISLAWAIFLHSLPPDRTPPNHGYQGLAWQEMSARAINSNLFSWLENILVGTLFSSSDRSETSRRKVMKDLLIGLADLKPLADIPDRSGLYRLWDLLFSTGSPSSSLALSADYWLADYPNSPRRAVLDKSEFPHNPILLPHILSSLSGITSEDAKDAQLSQIQPISRVAECFTNNPNIVIPTEPGWYRFVRKDAEGRMVVEAARNIVLPGGMVIGEGQLGTVLRTEQMQIVSWETGISAWGLLIEILRAALGNRDMNQIDQPAQDNSVYLSVAALGITNSPTEVLVAGLRLLSCVLKPIGGIANGILDYIPTTDSGPIYAVLDLVFTSLVQEPETSTIALDILVSLLFTHPSIVLSAFRYNGFFGIPGRKRGLVCQLVQADSAGATHDVTAGILRLVSAMVSCSEQDGVLRAAVHHTFVDIWSMFGGWRYVDSSKKAIISTRICELYETILSHPTEADGVTPTPAAAAVVEVLITSASTVTYRPLVELLQTSTQRSEEAVTRSAQAGINLLAALFRVAPKAAVPATSLPFSLFTTTTIVGSEKISLIEAINQFAINAIPSIRIGLLRLTRIYLESTSLDPRKASLAGLLRNADLTCTQLCTLASEDATPEQQAATWDLLASIVSTQPGCAPACIGTGPNLAPPLESAISEITARDIDDSRILSSLLAFCRIALASPSASSSLSTIRAKSDFWKAVFEIAMTPVAVPPSFQLSIQAPDFASRITAYAYATQVRANAVSLLATELQLLEDDEKSQALDLILGTWRNGDKLEGLVNAAIHSSCEPDLQAREVKRVEAAGVNVERWRTIKMLCEREYGLGFLYDGNPRAKDSQYQSMVNLGVDTLNLNWSMLEADVSLTRAFRELAEGVSAWVDGDALAAKAAMRAAAVVGEIAAEERRQGDVLLAVQTERLTIMALLLEIGDNDDLLGTICSQVRMIIETSSPISSMRQPNLPPIHRPALRILQSLFARLATRPMSISIESTVEVGGSFILEAADIALDSVSRGTGAPSDLALTITPFCNMINLRSTVWLDKLSSSNLIMRSLELITRVRIQSDNVPAYLPSILLLHLALANHPGAAEKLATSGILPTYSNNVIAIQAEYGKIVPDVGEYSVHSAWCGMLLVIKTLLASLPETATFIRSDVIPFIRLTTAQTIRSMTWDPESPLSLPALQEMQSTVELFHSISSIGSTSLLADFASSSLPLLISIRFALNHPRLLSTQIAPSTEEEQSQLHAELEAVDGQQEVNLVNFGKTPILAGRTAELVSTARTILLALVGLSGAWGIMSGQKEADEGLMIISEDEVSSTSTDPIGIFNDFQSIANTLSEQISANTDEGTSLLRVSHQLAEAGNLLSASQIYVRKVLLPTQSDEGRNEKSSQSKGGRVSLGSGSERDRAEALLREVEGDWRGIINADGAVGDRALARRLEESLDKAFEDIQE